jgi:hydroxymethylpyrimidine pyrophosphatase-like HAD family hydrolase
MVIAVDVDGTLYDGIGVADEAVSALRDARQRGHIIIIVTGRRWEDLPSVIPSVLPLAALAVCEEGGVLVDISTREIQLLGDGVDPELVAQLVAGAVAPLDVGHVVVGVPSRYMSIVLEIQERCSGSWVVSPNKDSISLAPPGCDKGTGLKAAVLHLGLEGLPILSIGDATNDLAMFRYATWPVAVANCDSTVRASGVFITSANHGHGVAEALQRFAVDR